MTDPIDEWWPRPQQPGTPDDQPTQPIVPPTPTPSALADAPPPSGLHGGHDPVAVEPEDWQSRFERQQTRTRIFMGTTAAAVAALLGSLFFAVAQSGVSGPGAVTPAGSGPGVGRLQGPGHDGPGSAPDGFDDSHGFDPDGHFDH